MSLLGWTSQQPDVLAILSAIAGTAIVVGVLTVLLTRRAVLASVTRSIGGRDGANPVLEHGRLLHGSSAARVSAEETADLLRQSLEALASGVVLTDTAGKVLVTNQLATRLATRAHEQALLDAATSEMLEAAATGRSDERELEVFGPPARTLFIRAVPVMMGAAIVGALAVIEDVSEHHRIDKTRRDFVANLSHELRTPVGAASLLGEMLVDEDDPVVRKQLTDRLLVETDRMVETIDDLLELSRIESEGQTYEETVHVQSVIDEALARTRVAAESSSVQIHTSVVTKPIMITANRDQLLTALVNLVENAVKYSAAGDSVTVRSGISDDQIELSVQDTGRGIPARDLDRVFERFYRVDRSRGAETGGTGIGLSIVRHVAMNHGGEVTVSSFEGEGSTFTMRLPVLQQARQP